MMVRIWGMKRAPAMDTVRPSTSASAIAVWIERDRRSSSWLPKNCPEITAHPAPRPTEKPTASSNNEAVACTPPSASLPPNCPRMKVLMRACACWKNELKKMGTHRRSNCCQITPVVTSSDAAPACRASRLPNAIAAPFLPRMKSCVYSLAHWVSSYHYERTEWSCS